MTASTTLGILGDLHGAWDPSDVAYFQDAPYDQLVFVGDLGPGTRSGDVRTARSIARIGAPTLVMPGNNDARHAAAMEAELRLQRGLGRLSELLGPASIPPLKMVEWCGYSLHHLLRGAVPVTILAARPFAVGASEIGFPELLAERHGVRHLKDSTEKLVALVDAVGDEPLVVLAHNGPAGLGAERLAPWGADFRPEGGDWGDEDLAIALRHAKQRGRDLRAVVAGHMHHRTRGGRTRQWKVMHEGVLHVNAARVPRIHQEPRGEVRHHVRLTITETSAEANEVLVR